MRNLLCGAERSGRLTLATEGRTIPVCVSQSDWKGVLRAAGDLCSDFGRITGESAQLITDLNETDGAGKSAREVIIAGTVGKNRIIDRLIGEGKIPGNFVSERNEAYSIRVVENPSQGIDRALVIAGADKRGTIFGIYEISEQIGVSPWHWWADVPPKRRDALFLSPDAAVDDAPSVRYRGIFLNDEYPALTNWIAAKYGYVEPREWPPMPQGVANYGSDFYAKIFELLLRMKANFLWPAMWNNSFYEDDPENARLADEYGIVVGNSHQEPMLRAQKEWDRRYLETLGHWDWRKHRETLEKFWEDGVRRTAEFDSVVTIGLRGADDTELAPDEPLSNRERLEKIVERQREIIARATGKESHETPQLWCLYKETQEFYEEGMRVPDDVTLLWSDDNWGNQRRLPTPEEGRRNGGAGIYYHFDYHGGPRSYQWTNTIPTAKIWDQMSLARDYGADRVWIVNVGHLKGYEYPISFFLEYAWAPERYTHENLADFSRAWASRTFGEKLAEEAAFLIETRARYNGRKKPELLDGDAWSQANYGEAERVVAEWDALAARAESFHASVGESARDASFQLIKFPTIASAVVANIYAAAGRNALYARQGRAAANGEAETVRSLFAEYERLKASWNEELAGGKWAHFTDQTILGYDNWFDPEKDGIDHLGLRELTPLDEARMGVAVEGSVDAWISRTGESDLHEIAAPPLPAIDPFSDQNRWIEIFNRGRGSFEYRLEVSDPWIRVSRFAGAVSDQERVFVSVDWERARTGTSVGFVTVHGAGDSCAVPVSAFNPEEGEKSRARGFVETDFYLAIDAAHFDRNVSENGRGWIVVPGPGKADFALRASAEPHPPALTPNSAGGDAAPRAEYRAWFFHAGIARIDLHLTPSLNFIPGRAITIGVSVDSGKPHTIVVVPEDYRVSNENEDWGKSVVENGRIVSAETTIETEGEHLITVWMLSPGVCLERIIVDMGGLRPSAFGPPESPRQ